MREVSTTHIRNNIGAVANTVLGGETLVMVRGTRTGRHVVGYLVPPRLFDRLVELAPDLLDEFTTAAEQAGHGLTVHDTVDAALRQYVGLTRPTFPTTEET